jgi:hypothetical protein
MTLAEKLEQAFTKRPNSYVPAHTLERLLGLRQGIRGPVGSFLHLNLRLLNDQTLENATGVGAPPWTWPVDEQVTDLLHKAIYAYATGAAADWLVDAAEDQERVKDAHYYE